MKIRVKFFTLFFISLLFTGCASTNSSQFVKGVVDNTITHQQNRQEAQERSGKVPDNQVKGLDVVVGTVNAILDSIFGNNNEDD